MTAADTLRDVDYRDLLAKSSAVGIAVRVAQRNSTGLDSAAVRAADLVKTLARHGYHAELLPADENAC